MHYLLFYDAVDGYVEKRVPFRSSHLERLEQSHQLGDLVLAGALADPVDGAVLVFRDQGAAEAFAKSDPYVLNGLVREWRVRPWTTVIGDGIPHAGIRSDSGRPEPSEYPPYAKVYVDLVAADDLLYALNSQLEETTRFFKSFGDRRASEFSYAPGKWTIKQVIGHVIDSERVFAYRALRFSRGDTTPLPGYEQDDYVKVGNFNEISLPRLLADYRTVRESTIALFRDLPKEAWRRGGLANNFQVTVRGLAFQIAGHEQHHLKIVRERYL